MTRSVAVSALASTLATALLAGCAGTPLRASPAVEPEAIRRAMTAVADWQLAHPSVHAPDGWQVAPFWAGLVAFAPLATKGATYLEAAREHGRRNRWAPGPRAFLADDDAITQSYFMLHTIDRDPRQIATALARFDRLLRQPAEPSLEFGYEKMSRAWVWCDALFMAPPALAMATRATGDRRYADLMSRLWWRTTDSLYDRDERLFYRDSRFVDRREPNGARVFWSRANGWVLAGLARVLHYLPPDHADRPRFVALFREVAGRVAGLQGADGYWRSSLLDPERWPAPETSGTGLFTYALAWGVNEGLLERSAFEPVVRRGWSALARAVAGEGMLGSVQGPDEGPGETRAGDTEVYASGAFLLAGSEVYRLVAKP